jgi:hypothetical protein
MIILVHLFLFCDGIQPGDSCAIRGYPLSNRQTIFDATQMPEIFVSFSHLAILKNARSNPAVGMTIQIHDPLIGLYHQREMLTGVISIPNGSKKFSIRTRFIRKELNCNIAIMVVTSIEMQSHGKAKESRSEIWHLFRCRLAILCPFPHP